MEAPKVTAKEQLAWPKTLAGKAQPQRMQQMDSLLQTLHGLGLLRKTEGEQYVR